MAKQQRLFDGDAADPEIAKAADRYVELLGEKKENKEALDTQQSRLISLMKRQSKSRVVHKGNVIEVVHKDETENIKIKKAKAASK
jgi:hypothetical protein